ncbi:hypothetical protein B4N89_08670 [Embleya scabrispora]|uniref:Uncharacterized protein n=1 Tax=Embleya scabrispora TaxID=159449 RepID=A0A1T3NWI6_9ACTN|nr:hypothetical protein B4N89_08670 [Embleya scabrispora]
MTHPLRRPAAPQLAATEAESVPEPPGSGITIAVYRVGPEGVRVLVPPERHKRSARDPWPTPDPPCRCSPNCPMR